ncbi:MAG TPA: YiiX/YebB-like N1pC/P60 family cysteine hydrolase [Flavilitoribacter sp.]|nr:YiiX/YebB-like N1pC/P60 family cysteine hydrolase [Flavilitoribacter sp.]HMQ86280.1 YiiX/YebB-like N1pC/P60 family cysteine hydrolase [Flavilitoribacter sp.]
MRRGFGLALLVVLIFVAWLFSRFGEDRQQARLSGQETDAGARLPDEVAGCLRTGDIILRESPGWVSGSIVAVLKEPRPFSHVGMLVREGDGWQVIHSISGRISSIDGLRMEPLPVFLKDALPGQVLISRLKWGDPDKMTAAAKDFLARKIPFDGFFDLTDTSAFYCSEFVYEVLKRSGTALWAPDTLPNGRPFLGFRRYYDEQFTELIYDAKAGY